MSEILEESKVEQVDVKFDITINQVYIQIYHANKGQGIQRHEHNVAHATMCHAGKIRITKQGVSLDMTKNDRPVMLAGNSWHEIEALEDGTVFVNIFGAK